MTIKAITSLLSVACVASLITYGAQSHLIPSGHHPGALGLFGDGAGLIGYANLARGNNLAFRYNGTGIVDPGVPEGIRSLTDVTTAASSIATGQGHTLALGERHAFVVKTSKPVIPPLASPMHPAPPVPRTSPFTSPVTPAPVLLPYLVDVDQPPTSLAPKRPSTPVGYSSAQHIAV